MRASRLSLVVVGKRAGLSIMAGLASVKLVVLVYPRCFGVVCPIQHLDERLQRSSRLQAHPVWALVASKRCTDFRRCRTSKDAFLWFERNTSSLNSPCWKSIAAQKQKLTDQKVKRFFNALQKVGGNSEVVEKLVRFYSIFHQIKTHCVSEPHLNTVLKIVKTFLSKMR